VTQNNTDDGDSRAPLISNNSDNSIRELPQDQLNKPVIEMNNNYVPASDNVVKEAVKPTTDSNTSSYSQLHPSDIGTYKFDIALDQLKSI